MIKEYQEVYDRLIKIDWTKEGKFKWNILWYRNFYI